MAINTWTSSDDGHEILADALNRDLLPLDAVRPEDVQTEANPVVENVIGTVLKRLKDVSE